MMLPMWMKKVLVPPPLDGDERSERLSTLHRLVVTGLGLLAAMLLASTPPSISIGA